MKHGGKVYILTNSWRRVLYTGVTSDLTRRLDQHRSDGGSGFTTRYRVNKLVYFESFDRIEDAIAREKQIKGGSRADKIALIESVNPDWKDLAEEGEYLP